MKKGYFFYVLFFWHSVNCSMENPEREEIIIKVFNQTPHMYYLKIPEEFIAPEDYLESEDEYQRWKVTPNKDEEIVFSVPRASMFSLAVQIKSCCIKDKRNQEDIEIPCIGTIVIYKNNQSQGPLIHFRQKFQSSISDESKEPIHRLMLIIKEKSSGGSTLLQLYK